MINIPKGTKDVLPEESYKWQFVEDTARKIAEVFNYKEIRTPVFEHTELFLRSVGETTDVVNKEMYTFEDKGGRSITLKPEGTAGAARLFIENGLSATPLPVKTFYITPAFRYERPQKGRLREFHQFGIEVFGSPAPETDAEVIFAASSFLNKLGIKNTRLEINSIGCKTCRNDYQTALKNYFAPHIENMCATCKERFNKNPLRLLDCKEEKCKAIAINAPQILDYLCEECSTHFNKVRAYLDLQNVKYSVNSRIVRGLDYYTKTVFEFISEDIGAQGTVCGGGRYDNLLEELGGSSLPAIGFAAGIERLLLVMESIGANIPDSKKPRIYAAGIDENCRKKALEIVMSLRGKGINAETDLMGRSVKAQMKYADKLGAEYVAVIGENELLSGTVNLKKMADGNTASVKFDDIYTYLIKGV